MDVISLYRADDGIMTDLCIFLVKQLLIAHAQDKGMGSKHFLAEAGKVFHFFVTTDFLIHQQAIVGKVVFMHRLNINNMVGSTIDGKQITPHGTDIPPDFCCPPLLLAV